MSLPKKVSMKSDMYLFWSGEKTSFVNHTLETTPHRNKVSKEEEDLVFLNMKLEDT